jgi:hypothetical protein
MLPVKLLIANASAVGGLSSTSALRLWRSPHQSARSSGEARAMQPKINQHRFLGFHDFMLKKNCPLLL